MPLGAVDEGFFYWLDQGEGVPDRVTSLYRRPVIGDGDPQLIAGAQEGFGTLLFDDEGITWYVDGNGRTVGPDARLGSIRRLPKSCLPP